MALFQMMSVKCVIIYPILLEERINENDVFKKAQLQHDCACRRGSALLAGDSDPHDCILRYDRTDPIILMSVLNFP